MDYNPAYGANLPDPSVILPEEIYQSDYEQVSSVVSSRQTTLAQSVEKSRNKELMEDPRLEEKKSRCRGVLVCFAMFVVCIILALLVAFTALLIFEILANRTLMAELDEVKQNSESKFDMHIRLFLSAVILSEDWLDVASMIYLYTCANLCYLYVHVVWRIKVYRYIFPSVCMLLEI